jgi:outer membrane protein TolC
MKAMLGRTLVLTGALALTGSSSAAAQTAPAAKTLGEIYRAAFAADPRTRQLEIEAEQAALRKRALDATRLPSLRVEGRAQHQSDVPSFPLRDPAGAPLITPPKSTVDAFVGVDQRIVDPTYAPRAALIDAELEEARARVSAAVFAIRQEVDEAFFAAGTAAARERVLLVRIGALERLLEVARARVAEGAALPSEARVIEAALLQRRQDVLQATAARRVSLGRLARLTGGAVTEETVLVIPDDVAMPQGPDAAAASAGRPEHRVYDAQRARIARQADAIGAEARPRVSAFARAGVGRPGLNFIADEFDTYWLGGVQLQWTPWSWGAHAREREALALEGEVVATEAAAFTSRLDRAMDAGAADVARLEAALDLDTQILALREQIEQETRIRWEARVIPLAEYLDRSGELLDAQLARDERRIALAAARARVRTIAGMEVR